MFKEWGDRGATLCVEQFERNKIWLIFVNAPERADFLPKRYEKATNGELMRVKALDSARFLRSKKLGLATLPSFVKQIFNELVTGVLFWFIFGFIQAIWQNKNTRMSLSLSGQLIVLRLP